MSNSLQSSLHSPRVVRFPGKLKSAHLAAIIGVKSLTTFREPAAYEASATNEPKTAPRGRPPLPNRVGLVLRVHTAG